MSKEIVLGLGDNIDYELHLNSVIMEEMIRKHGILCPEIDINRKIINLRDILISILGFLRQEEGGERQVENAEIIECFAGLFETKITLGGTAVRSAIVMAKLGFSSAVHLVTTNEHVSRLLPPDCERLCSNPEPSSYPHLIVQYNGGLKINANDIHIETTRANRIIYVNDKDNTLMRLHPGLDKLLSGAKVFMISGFNAMHDASLLEDRLRQLEKAMQSLPRQAVVFYEDAGFHFPGMQTLVWRYLLPRIHIYSLNEDELQAYLGKPAALTNAGAVSDALKALEKLIPVPVLVLHTRYWALAYGRGAAAYTKALQAGVIMATSRFQLGDDFTRQDYEETSRLPPEKEGAAFVPEIQALLGDQVCCVPALRVSETKVTTIGLGDSFVGGFIPALL